MAFPSGSIARWRVFALAWAGVRTGRWRVILKNSSNSTRNAARPTARPIIESKCTPTIRPTSWLPSLSFRFFSAAWQSSSRKQAVRIFGAALRAADPAQAVLRNLRLRRRNADRRAAAVSASGLRQHLRSRRRQSRSANGARGRAVARPADSRRSHQHQVRPYRSAAPDRVERVRPSGAGPPRRSGRPAHRGDRESMPKPATW